MVGARRLQLATAFLFSSALLCSALSQLTALDDKRPFLVHLSRFFFFLSVYAALPLFKLNHTPFPLQEKNKMAPKLAGWSSVALFVLGLFVLAFDGVGGGVVVGGVGLGERAVVGSVAGVVGSVAVAGGCLTSSSCK